MALRQLKTKKYTNANTKILIKKAINSHYLPFQRVYAYHTHECVYYSLMNAIGATTVILDTHHVMFSKRHVKQSDSCTYLQLFYKNYYYTYMCAYTIKVLLLL